MTDRVFTAIAGVSFRPEYPGNLLALAETQYNDGRPTGEGTSGVLIAEPDNEYDPNAVQVHSPSVGFIGYLPKRMAADAQLKLRQGLRPVCEIEVRVHPDHPERPGADIIVTWHDAMHNAPVVLDDTLDALNETEGAFGSGIVGPP